jgi:hypothetical protein
VASLDELVKVSERWLFERGILLPSDRILRDTARKAFASVERAALQVIEAAVPAHARTICQSILFEPIASKEGPTVLEWLKSSAARHSPSTLTETWTRFGFSRSWGCRAAMQVSDFAGAATFESSVDRQQRCAKQPSPSMRGASRPMDCRPRCWTRPQERCVGDAQGAVDRSQAQPRMLETGRLSWDGDHDV